MSKFLTVVSIVYKVEIMQLFPVRGHSYNQCDRNVGMYARKLKKLQSVETQDEYLDVIRTCRDVPFIVRNGQVKNFEKALSTLIKISNKFEISKAAALVYKPDGTIAVHKNYSLVNPKFFSHVDPSKINDNIFENIPLENCKGVADFKKRDVLSLLPYIKICNREFYTQYLSGSVVKGGEDVLNESDYSDLEY